MKSVLIIITHAFPYAPPMEQYLLDEIEVLKNYFDDILIFPSSRTALSFKMNELNSSNIKVLRIQRKNKLYEAVTTFFSKTIFDMDFYKEIITLINKKLIFNRVALQTLLITYLNKEIITEGILEEFNTLKFNKDDSIIIYSYWLSHYSSVAIALKNKIHDMGFNNLKCIARAHGSSDVFISKLTNEYKIDIRNIRDIDRIYSVSDMGARYIEKIGIETDKIKVGRLGVKDRGYKLSLKKGEILKIVSCSNLVDVKRVHLIVEALCLIDDVTIEWTHFGDGILMDQIKNMSENIGNNIKIMLMGKTKNAEIMKYYKNNSPDLFINVSSIEGIPVAIMEAISFGIPVIATDVGGTKEICLNNYNGILLEKDFQIERLVQSIKYFNGLSEEAYMEFCINARALYQNKFNSNINYKIFSEDMLNITRSFQ